MTYYSFSVTFYSFSVTYYTNYPPQFDVNLVLILYTFTLYIHIIGVEAPRNVVLVSMPSLVDPSLAPVGKHVIHAYVPATEPYEWWEGLNRTSIEYKQKKAEAADFLWKAVEQYIPDARVRSDKRVEQIGTPLTHERFLRRSYGTYGPRVIAGEQSLPGHSTLLKKLWTTGDFTFPGIGVPAAAASGAITANSIMNVFEQMKLLDKIRLPDKF